MATPTLDAAARFLLMRVAKRDPPKGIALSKVLLALAGLARAQRAFKLARFAYSRLQVSRMAGAYNSMCASRCC